MTSKSITPAAQLIHILISDEFKHSKISLDYVQSLMPKKLKLKRPQPIKKAPQLSQRGVKVQVEYQTAIKIHNLWTKKVNTAKPKDDSGIAFKKSSLIGAKAIVTKSKNRCLQGCKGIVIMETAKTFHIATKDNKTKIVPKQGALFTFIAGERCFEIYGSHILSTPNERVTKKCKHLVPPDEVLVGV